MSVTTYTTPENRRLSRLHIEAQGNLFATKWQGGEYQHSGGGFRGEVTDFSPSSRRRLLRKMARLTIHNQATFLTLTYPERYPDSARSKENLRAFTERLRRIFPKSSAIWRIEYQERGAPHFHLIVFNIPFIPWRIIQRWWAEIISDYVDEHLPRIRIERIRSKAGAMHYVSKYIAKMPDRTDVLEASDASDQPGAAAIFIYVSYLHAGRWWGIFNRDFLPYAPASYIVIRIETGKAFYDLKRTMRRIWPHLTIDRGKGGVIFTDQAYRMANYAMTLALADINDEYGSDLIQVGAKYGN